MLLIFIVPQEVVSILTTNRLLGQECLLLRGTTQIHDTNRKYNHPFIETRSYNMNKQYVETSFQ